MSHYYPETVTCALHDHKTGREFGDLVILKTRWDKLGGRDGRRMLNLPAIKLPLETRGQHNLKSRQVMTLTLR